MNLIDGDGDHDTMPRDWFVFLGVVCVVGTLAAAVLFMSFGLIVSALY